MSDSSKAISPLRQRMIEDMCVRKLSPGTLAAYIRAVKGLSGFLGHSPVKATAEDQRLFQLHLSNTGTSTGTINATVSGFRFFFETTLLKPDLLKKIATIHEPRRLSVILSREEVTALLKPAL